MSATFSVVVPRSHTGLRFASVTPPAHDTSTTLHASDTPNYVRRRVVVVGLLVFALALVLFGAGGVLASRGGDPASTPAARPATSYIVRPGDTLWSLANTFHGPWSRASYLDRLLDGNGGSEIQVGQLLELP
ncbi:MAG: LysM peptidoglycan-binding domain-containing protein [Ilumatobacteraceae bacterium]